MFGLGKGEPALTKSARKVSDIIASLDDVGRERACQTVRGLIVGIQGLGSLPPDVAGEMWTMLVTVARKAVVGASEEKLFSEIRAGLSDDLITLIEREVKQ